MYVFLHLGVRSGIHDYLVSAPHRNVALSVGLLVFVQVMPTATHGHSAFVTALAWSPDGLIGLGGKDGRGIIYGSVCRVSVGHVSR